MDVDSEPATELDLTAMPRARLVRLANELVHWLRTLTSAAIYAVLIVTFGFQIARVEGRSMEPALENQDRLVVNKFAYRVHAPEVGDIVMLLRPDDPSQTLVKRIVAEPGDTVAFRHGLVLRNGVIAAEDFIPGNRRSDDDRESVVVPEGFYFVLGDNRKNSADSRSFGAVPQKYILGKVQVRWWPPATARIFEP
jgi:signal peptidase I